MFLTKADTHFRVRSLRTSGPVVPSPMGASPIILPLEQRAMWRNIAPPRLRSGADADAGTATAAGATRLSANAGKFYSNTNPV